MEMEKITAFIKKNWVWVVAILIIIILFYMNKKKKQAEATALAAFNKINSLVAQSKTGSEFENEKKSLLNLINDTTNTEKEILSDLLNGSIAIFSSAEQEKDKEKAKNDFSASMSKMQSDLVTKYGKQDVTNFKAKMDKYGFDI
jgi:Zn-dependent M32 family carboxypeptidase